MKTKNVGLILAAFVVSLSLAPAAFAEGEVPVGKANNGWGNGIDGDNAGTPKGGTAESKENQPDTAHPKHDGR